MKVLLVLMFVSIAAATALAFSGSVAAAAGQVADSTSEPAALLVSGSLLLGLAGAVKRFSI